MKKNIYFKGGKLIPGTIGAALSGSNQKVDLGALCKKVNAENACIDFCDMKMKLELTILNKQLTYRVVLLLKELLNYFSEEKNIKKSHMLKIIELKKKEFNTNKTESIQKTIISYAKQIKLNLID